jgi:hypothetical protein
MTARFPLLRTLCVLCALCFNSFFFFSCVSLAKNLDKPLQSIDDKVTDMTCLPDNLAGRTYFKPTDQGFEQRQRLDEIRKIKSRTAPGS